MLKDVSVDQFLKARNKYDSLQATPLSDRPSDFYQKKRALRDEINAIALNVARETKDVEAIYWICEDFKNAPGQTQLSAKEFVDLLEHAANQNHTESMLLLADYYSGAWEIHDFDQKNTRRTRMLYKKAAEHGNNHAKFEYAKILLKKKGCQEEAETLLRELVKTGYLMAYHLLYTKFYMEEGAPHKDKSAEGFKLLKSALKHIERRGDGYSYIAAHKIYHLLAMCYDKGHGCKNDKEKAIFYMRQSVNVSDSSDGARWLARRGLTSDDENKDTSKDISKDTPSDVGTKKSGPASDGANQNKGDKPDVFKIFNEDNETGQVDDDENYLTTWDIPELVIELDEPLSFIDFSKKPKVEQETQIPLLTKEDLERVLQPFDNLIGLNNIREQINELFYMIAVEERRRKIGVESNFTPSLHMVFTGNPGTGKTMVARMLGKVLKELRLLKKGHVVEVDRSKLVGQYIGQTEFITREVFKRAHDGILFIDEAYSLEKGYSPNDFGHEVMAMLVKEMEDRRKDLVVIFAGYPEEMKWMLDSNPGMNSRIGLRLDFPDYNIEQLAHIFVQHAKDIGFIPDKGVLERVMGILRHMDKNKLDKFGNARGMRNLLEQTIRMQSKRVFENDITGKKKIMTILSDDIPGEYKPHSDGKIITLH